MATFKHVESGKRLLFIHIPRTAGRFVEWNLVEQGWEWDERSVLITCTRVWMV